jgi:hypothetical protein
MSLTAVVEFAERHGRMIRNEKFGWAKTMASQRKCHDIITRWLDVGFETNKTKITYVFPPKFRTES